MEELLNAGRFLFLAELNTNHLADRKVCDKDTGMRWDGFRLMALGRLPKVR